MSWLEDHARNQAERTMGRAYKVVGPGYGWAGGKFGRLFTRALIWACLLFAVAAYGYRWINGPAKHANAPASTTTEAPADNPKGGF